MNLDIDDRLIYFAAGCGFGLALGALFAPQSGRQTRQNLTNRVEDLAHKVQDKIQSSGIRETAGRKWHDVVQKGKNVASIRRERFGESLEDDDLVQG